MTQKANKQLFKILMYKGEKWKILGKYPLPMKIKEKVEWGSSNVPQLMTVETTIRKLQQIYPKLSFEDVKLIPVGLSELV